MPRPRMTRMNERRVCPMCRGQGYLLDDLDQILARKEDLYREGKIKHGSLATSRYEYLFARYGFTPSLAEAMTIYDIGSLDVYQKLFLPRIQAVGLAYIKSRESARSTSRKRREFITERDDGTITESAILALLKSQEFLCNICKISIKEVKNRHLDHIHPISRGGAHTLSNVQWLCPPCNLRKHNKVIL